jgi:hypothetical protein
LVAGSAVFADRDGRDGRLHTVAAEYAVEVVDLVGGESGDAVLEHCDEVSPINLLVLDLDAARPGHHAAHIEKAQAAFVLFVLPAGLLDDPGAEQCDRLAFAGADDG